MNNSHSSNTSSYKSMKETDLNLSNQDVRQIVLENSKNSPKGSQSNILDMKVKSVANILKDKKERKNQYEENTEKLVIYALVSLCKIFPRTKQNSETGWLNMEEGI